MEDVKEAAIQNLQEAESPVEEADAGIQQDDVNLDEILPNAQGSEAENPDAVPSQEPAETVENKEDDAPSQATPEADATEEPKAYRSQDEFNAAFSKRMRKEREENRPFIELGRAVTDVTGGDLTAEEIQAALNTALADKRAKENKTDFDTEMNNIRVEQRVAKRFAPPAEKPIVDTPQPQATAAEVETRTKEMISAMEVIGDESFTVEALQGNKAALAEWVGGATPAQVYRKYFIGAPVAKATPAKRPAVERRANGGATGTPPRTFSERDIAAIDAAVEKGKTVRF